MWAGRWEIDYSLALLRVESTDRYTRRRELSPPPRECGRGDKLWMIVLLMENLLELFIESTVVVLH